VKIGGVWGDTKMVNGIKYLQNQKGNWELHPTETRKNSITSAAFGINKTSSMLGSMPGSERGHPSVRSSAPVQRRAGF
jgi:hypothetical protein